MIKGEYKQLNNMIGNHVCGTCDGRLNVVKCDEGDDWKIVCGKCGDVKTLTEVAGPAKLDRTDPTLPVARTMGDIEATDLGTGELLPVEKIQELDKWAHELGLDARLGHAVYMYGDKYVTIDGYLYHANKSGRPYSLTARPMDADERRGAMIGENDHAWTGRLEFPGTGSYFTATGIVTEAETLEPSKRDKRRLAHPVVSRYPWQLAEKRAKWQALRYAFPLERQKDAPIIAGDDTD